MLGQFKLLLMSNQQEYNVQVKKNICMCIANDKFEYGRIWDLVVSVPDHCLFFYFEILKIKTLDHLFNIGFDE